MSSQIKWSGKEARFINEAKQSQFAVMELKHSIEKQKQYLETERSRMLNDSRNQIDSITVSFYKPQ